jgi:hypothetical protein
VFRATGIRLSELAGIKYDDDPQRGDVDLWHREITVHGKGRKTRIVKISHGAARAVDLYIRVRARHAQAYRPQLWLGVNNRGPLTACGRWRRSSGPSAEMSSCSAPSGRLRWWPCASMTVMLAAHMGRRWRLRPAWAMGACRTTGSARAAGPGSSRRG